MSEILGGVIAISGLLAGGIISLIVFLIMRKTGKKKRWHDERYNYVSTNARADSWVVTLVVLFIAWIVVILVEGVSFSFFLMTALWVAHCLGYLVTAAYHGTRN